MGQWKEIDFDNVELYLVLDVIFALIYTFEVLIKWRHQGVKPYFWADGKLQTWQLIDFVLTTIAIVDVVGRGFMPPSLVKHILAPLSVLRLARLIRILRLLDQIPSLSITIGGVLGSLAPLVWIVIALLCAIYVFAILFTFTVRHCKPDLHLEEGIECSQHYLNSLTAMQTLTDVVVFAKWTETIPTSQPYLLAPFYMFALVSAFGIINVLVGVIVDATADTKLKLEWTTKRKHLLQLGKMWEEEIHSKGLSREALSLLNEDERNKKQTERRAAVRGIIADIIESDLVSFPPGTVPEEVRLLLDRNGDGRVSHEDFTVGFGRILLADPFQQSMMSFINQAMIRRHVREIHERWDELIEDVKENGRKYDALGEVVGEMTDRFEKLEQAVKEKKSPRAK